jgi:hypothetical protein
MPLLVPLSPPVGARGDCQGETNSAPALLISEHLHAHCGMDQAMYSLCFKI